MRSLFALLWKNQFFVLFVILEFFSIFLLTKSYSYHGSLAYSTTSDVSGSIFSSYSNLTDYLSLKDQNDILTQENALLRNQLLSSFNVTDTNFVYRDSNYRYIPVKVVKNSVNRSNNFILVNKGSKHGVKKEMGVISSTGLSGIVVGVSENYSTIMSMLHSEIRISARIKNSGQLVNVIWDKPDYLFGSVIDIPSHIQLSTGDSIVTSGNSLIFPEGIMIGVIEEHNTNLNKNLSDAVLRFSTDFNSILHLYLIENMMKTEQDSIVITTENE